MYMHAGGAGGHDGPDADDGSDALSAIGGSNMAPFLTKLFQIVSASSTVSSIDRRSW